MHNDIQLLLSEEVNAERQEIGYETDCLLIYDKLIRKQKYVLNSLREIAGIRIVTVISPTEPRGESQVVGIRLKYTPSREQTLLSYTAFLKRSILSTNGVLQVRFLHTTKVKL